MPSLNADVVDDTPLSDDRLRDSADLDEVSHRRDLNFYMHGNFRVAVNLGCQIKHDTHVGEGELGIRDKATADAASGS